MENRYVLFIPEEVPLKLLKNVMGVHKYSVNDAVRAFFGIFSFSNFRSLSISILLGAPCKLKHEFFSLSSISR